MVGARGTHDKVQLSPHAGLMIVPASVTCPQLQEDSLTLMEAQAGPPCHRRTVRERSMVLSCQAVSGPAKRTQLQPSLVAKSTASSEVAAIVVGVLA